MLLPLRVSFRSATCQLSYSSVAMLTDSAEPSLSRMKPCCLPNWAGTGSSHVLTKRGIICLSIPSLTVFFSIVAAYSGVAGLPAHPASTRAAAGRARSIVLLSMAFLLLSRACGRPLRHAAPHEEPHAFIQPRLDAPRPAKPHGETFAMPQASIFGIALSPSPSP